MLSTFSNVFSSETTRPAEAKFQLTPPWDGETKVCSNSPGHMTKMAIYGKNLKKSSSLELGVQHRMLKYNQAYSNDDPGLTLTYFMARLNLVLHAFVWEKGKTMDFSELIVVYDVI